MTATSPKSNADIILDAIVDLHNAEQVATREILKEILDMPMVTIDDRLTHLVNTEKIVRIQRGVFKPLHVHKPARLMSKILLPDGSVIVDIGDDVLHLTPKEARLLGILLYAEAVQFSNIEAGHQLAIIQNEMSKTMREFGRMCKDNQKQTKIKAP